MLPSAQFIFDMCAGAYRFLKTLKITKGRLFHKRVIRLTTKLTRNSGNYPG